MSTPEPPTVLLRCPCGGSEQIGEHFHFRLHDHACPHMPADMVGIPDEVSRDGRANDPRNETGDDE